MYHQALRPYTCNFSNNVYFFLLQAGKFGSVSQLVNLSDQFCIGRAIAGVTFIKKKALLSGMVVRLLIDTKEVIGLAAFC